MRSIIAAVAALLLLAGPAAAVTRTASFSQTLDTDAKTSDSFNPLNGGQAFGFTVAISGSFSANWRLQASPDDGTTWIDVAVIDQPRILPIPTQAPALWRVSAAGSGDFTSGSATVAFIAGGQQAAMPLTGLLNSDGTVVGPTNPWPVGGLAANVSATMTKSTKTSAYSSGQLITQGTSGNSAALDLAVARVADASGMVRAARLVVDDSTWKNASVRVHLYKDDPTFTNGDAGNWAGGTSESGHLCTIDIVLDLEFSSTTVKGRGVPAIGNECNFEPSSGTKSIYAVLEARSTTAGSHTASSTFTLTVEALRN
jgi:hypothetical protein